MQKDQQGDAPVTEGIPDIPASDNWLHALVEQTLAGIYVIQDGYFAYVNQGFADIFGFPSPADIIATTRIADVIAPEDRQRVAENVQRRATGDVQEMRYTFVGLRKDGRRIDVEVHGRRMAFKGRPAVIGLILDITERKQAEAARLAEAAIRVTATVFESQEGMAVTNADFVILRANQAFTACTGFMAVEAVGEIIGELLHSPLHDDAFYAALVASLADTGEWKGEIWTPRKNGDVFPAWSTVTAVKNSAGVVTHHVVTITDITERKRLENEMVKRIDELKLLNERLEEAHNQLLQAEKMAAVGQLAAGIAHEINNPVGFVNSNLGTLGHYVGDLLHLLDAYRAVADACAPEHPAVVNTRQLSASIDLDFIRDDAVALLNESRDGLERVKRIVADLKDFSRVGESNWQMADIHKCLDSTLNVVANELKYKADVIKEYGSLPEILCMPFQLNQVFMNLLVNAAQAISERGTITLRSGRTVETVWIEVQDTGTGIDASNLKRIFEPFYTTKPVGSGTGLGLSVSYGIVQKHQGRIDVRSEPGKGSAFRVVLPIRPEGDEHRA